MYMDVYLHTYIYIYTHIHGIQTYLSWPNPIDTLILQYGVNNNVPKRVASYAIPITIFHRTEICNICFRFSLLK